MVAPAMLMYAWLIAPANRCASGTGKSDELLSHTSRGLGVRVLVNGAWGFAGSPDLEQGRTTVAAALEVGRASARLQKEPVQLADIPILRTRWQNPVQVDLHTVSFQERVDLLMAADAVMARQPGVTQRKSSMGFFFTDQIFASSKGAFIEQNLTACGAGLMALAAGDGEVQHRSFPASFQGNYATAGYEHVLGLGLVEGARSCAEQAAALLHADPCPPGRTTLVMDSSMMTLLIHESSGPCPGAGPGPWQRSQLRRHQLCHPGQAGNPAVWFPST